MIEEEKIEKNKKEQQNLKDDRVYDIGVLDC